jgi:hypothetical protein
MNIVPLGHTRPLPTKSSVGNQQQVTVRQHSADKSHSELKNRRHLPDRRTRAQSYGYAVELRETTDRRRSKRLSITT